MKSQASLSNPSPSEGYFVVGATKFIVMGFGTLGIYPLYWCYKNWKYIKNRDQSNIMPFWRAVFTMFWIFRLGEKIHDDCQQHSIAAGFNGSGIGFTYWSINALHRLPDPFSLVSIFSFLVLWFLEDAASKINKKLGVSNHKYSRFNMWNYVFLGIGTPILILGIIGSFLPPE